MHGFFNAGYFLILGFFSVIASMAFWFRDVISEGRVSNLLLKVLLYNYTLNIAKAISKEDIKQFLSIHSTIKLLINRALLISITTISMDFYVNNLSAFYLI